MVSPTGIIMNETDKVQSGFDYDNGKIYHTFPID